MKCRTFTLVVMLLVLALLVSAQGFYVSPGTTVTIGSGTTLDITNGNLLIQDDYSHAPSFLQNGTIEFTGSGEAQVEQYLTKDKWHIVSSPVQNEVIGAYMWIYLYEFQEPTNTWHYLNLPITLPLNQGQGYYCWAYTTDPNNTYPPSPNSVVFSGTLNAGDIGLNHTVTPSSIKTGWNLIGNPFPCALAWNGHADWNLVNLDASIWIWDPTAGNHKVWNYNTGGTLESGEIASTQGFWVHATDTVSMSGSSLTLPASQRVHSGNTFYKSTGSFVSQLKLKVQSSGAYNDETIIGFMEGTSAGFSPVYDAMYLAGGEPLAPSLYSVVAGAHFALKMLPDLHQHPSVDVNLSAQNPGTYTFSASGIESFPADLPIFLEDKKENYFQDLRQLPEYVFASELNDNTDRFVIHFSNPLGIDNRENVTMHSIYAFDKTVYIRISDPAFIQGYCIVYDIMGQKALSAEVTEGLNAISFPYNNGCYVVTLNTRTGSMITEKVYIR